MPNKKLKSLRGRLIITVTITALLSLFLLALVSYRTIGSIERLWKQAGMISDAKQLGNQMEQEYLSLIHLSQQMSYIGGIGILMQRHISAEAPYERIESSRELSAGLNLATFTNPKIQLAMYYTDRDDANVPVFSNIPFSTLATAADIDVLSRTQEITFHAAHPAISRVSNAEVVSVLQTVTFDDGIERFIYVELATDITAMREDLSDTQGMSYSLLQTDMNGFVLHSDLPDYPTGTYLDLSEGENQPDAGRVNGYVWSRSEEIFGFTNILMIPAADYDRELNRWITEMIVTAATVILLLIVVTSVLYREFYKPLHLLGQEIGKLGGGDMSQGDYHFRVTEYESLFNRFNQMKSEIQALIADATCREKEKNKLELDMLYYQINPHFLVNALSSARWQAAMAGDEDMAGYLSQLNYMMGYTLGKLQPEATLRTELQVTEAYLALQSSRLNFQLHMDVEEGLYLEWPCARMIFQPVAENAVCHNLDDFGNLWITARDMGGTARITIRDDGAGFDPGVNDFKSPPHTGGERGIRRGIGLRYVWLSLRAFYNERAGMEVASAPSEGTTVTFILPRGGDKAGGEAYDTGIDNR